MKENADKRGYLTEDFRLFYLKDDRGATVGYHYHEFYKLVFLLSGSGSYTVEGRHYQLIPGDIVLVGSRCVHKPQFEPGFNYERVILYISPELLRAGSSEDFLLEHVFAGKKGHVLRSGEEFRRKMLSMTSQLEGEMAGRKPGASILARCTLFRMLVTIGREMDRTDVSPAGPAAPKDEKILEILRFLDTNLTEDISIDELASRFYISKYHMMRRFREETGTSIHTYLSEKRLLLARELIRSGATATEACFQSGFRSYSAFSRAYSKLFGVTPTGRMTMQPLPDDAIE
ncbi:MAG: helix-turn-helix domain-containing protein [Oscillospiraceae bacterium]|nr:helix-turn-helix domain-containing protein [Oscillospiraceae bacterium]